MYSFPLWASKHVINSNFPLFSSLFLKPTLREIKIPWRYSDIHFDFHNIGSVMGTVVDVFGGALIERERQNLLGLIKKLIQSEVKSLICEEKVASQEELSSPLRINEDDWPAYDWKFLRFLQKERDSELVRDRSSISFCPALHYICCLRLAENTVKKIFEESIIRLLATHGSQLREGFKRKWNFHTWVAPHPL